MGEGSPCGVVRPVLYVGWSEKDILHRVKVGVDKPI